MKNVNEISNDDREKAAENILQGLFYLGIRENAEEKAEKIIARCEQEMEDKIDYF